MYRSLYVILIMVILFAVAPESRAGRIVVLTENPVAEFTLPDGTVLKNAYVWKRSSEGIMIIHDDGQYYLNFKTLPPDWRKAYEVLDAIEPIKAVAEKRDDQYTMFSVLEDVDALPFAAVAYFESNDYPGDADGPLLLACTYQSMLNGDYDKAVRFNKLVKDHFSDTKATIVDSWYLSCKTCYGTGVIFHPCVACDGSGKCKTCGGDGSIPSQFVNNDPLRCVKCKGTGDCPTCRGKSRRSNKCADCKGYGKLLRAEEVQGELDVAAGELEAIYRKSGR